MNDSFKKILILSGCIYLSIYANLVEAFVSEDPAETFRLLLIKTYPTRLQAEQDKALLSKRGIKTRLKKTSHSVSYHRLEFGPFSYQADAESLMDAIQKNGFSPQIIKRKYDYVIEMGRYDSKAELTRDMARAKAKGFTLVRDFVVNKKISGFELYAALQQNQIGLNREDIFQIIKQAKTSPQYSSRKKALEALTHLKEKNSAQAKVVKNQKITHQYYYGPYTDFVTALGVSNTLKKQNLDNKIVWDLKLLGYIVTLENKKQLNLNQLLSTHILNSLGKPEFTTSSRTTYQVVTRVTNPGDIVSTTAKAIKPKPKNKVSVLKTLSSPRAFRKLEQLHNKGFDSEVRQKTEDVKLQALVLTGIDSWAKAKKIAKRLKKNGIEAFPVSNRHDKHFAVTVGYQVSVGIYKNKEHIKNQLEKMKKLGFNRVKVVNYRKKITSYDVVVVQTQSVPKQTPGTVSEQHSENIYEKKAGSSGKEPNAIAFEKPSLEKSSDEEMMVFLDTDSLDSGSYDDASEESIEDQKNFHYGLDQLNTAYSLLPDRDDVSSVFSTKIDASATLKINSFWNSKLSLGMKLWQQQGHQHYGKNSIIANDAYLRYRGQNYRLTLGIQKILWGRLDGDAPTDMMSTRDFSFFMLDSELQDKRLGDASIRFESYFNNYKLDLVYTPSLMATRIPGRDSAYAFINQSTGRVLGTQPLPILEQLARQGTSDRPESGGQAIGIRFSHAGESVDYALTAQSTRIPIPIFSVNPQTLGRLFSGSSVEEAIAMTAGNTFQIFQPETQVVGGDFSWVSGSKTFRGEIAWISDYPVIRESTLLVESTPAVSWGFGIEAYPGASEDTRLILQLVGTQVLNDADTLGTVSSIGFNGQVETFFLRDNLSFKVNFLANINKQDLSVNPVLTYNGLTDQEIYISFFYFRGDEDTLGGYYDQSNTLTIGWKGFFN